MSDANTPPPKVQGKPFPTGHFTAARFGAVLFDLDGVVTATAKVHAVSWKRLFDEYLKSRSQREEVRFIPFDIEGDYLVYVDGKPRYEGVRSFLESRGIDLAYGNKDDAEEVETICGLGNGKNQHFNQALAQDGVELFEGAIRWINQLRTRGIAVAVVSSSKNCRLVLQTAAIDDLFAVHMDGLEAEKRGLPGKPAPDTFLCAAELLAVPPARAVVVEDAISGVMAGHDGHFGLVIGVDRIGQAADLAANGADVVVRHLSDLVDEND